MLGGQHADRAKRRFPGIGVLRIGQEASGVEAGQVRIEFIEGQQGRGSQFGTDLVHSHHLVRDQRPLQHRQVVLANEGSQGPEDRRPHHPAGIPPLGSMLAPGELLNQNLADFGVPERHECRNPGQHDLEIAILADV